jgi:hypothetical protein
MSVKSCIDGKSQKGMVNRELAKQAMDLFDQNLETARRGMGAADADARAGARTIAFLERELVRKKANAVRQAAAAVRLKKTMAEYRTAPGLTWGFRHTPDGETNLQRAAKAILNRDSFDQASNSNVWGRQNAVLAQLQSANEEAIVGFRAHIGGFARNIAGQKNVIRELFGEDTGDVAAKAIAKGWQAASEIARLRFNRAGGNIPKRKDWATVQSHDQLRVGKVEADEWINFVLPRLDPAKMIDEATGNPMTLQTLKEHLYGAYDDISTGGWGAREPQFTVRRSALANTRQQARQLHFKNADVWLEYQQKFGKPSVHDSMTAHLEHMSMDIAQMEILGPNPQAMVSYLGDVLRKEAAGKGRKAVAYAEKTAQVLMLDFYELSGKNAIVTTGAARSFSALANILTSAQLGAASLTAVSDLATVRLASKYNGVPAAKVIARMTKLLNPALTEDKRIALRIGLIAENWSSMAMAQARYTGEVVGPRWSQMLSDGVLKISGLSPWTQAGRWAFGMEFSGHLGDFVGRSLDQLPEGTRSALTRYGISSSDWDSLATMTGRRQSFDGVFIEHKGAKFLSSPAIMSFDQELGSKVAQMILGETEFAIPTVTPLVRRQLRFGSDPNTAMGMVAKSVAMYKSFPVGIVHSHGMRGMNQHTVGKKGAYMAALIASTTLMGALAWQMKHISKGRDPEDMTTKKFWAQAMTQGGGLGIFGDFLFADMTRFGQGALQQAAGPLLNFGSEALQLTLGNIQQGATGTKTNFGKEAIRFTQRYMPGSSLWYSRLALERKLFDRLDRMVDPHAASNHRRSEAALLRRTGQRMFWGKGDRTPGRAPDFGAAIGR